MKDLVSKKVFGGVLASAAGILLALYGWYVSWTEKQAALPDGKRIASDAQCTDEAVQIEKKNPNIKLFISCGGFLE